MPKFAANLAFLFQEWDFLDRFAAAADAGFTAVEYPIPLEHSPDLLAQRLHTHGLTQALLNLPAGDWAGGERGLAALPGRFEALKDSVEQGLPYLKATGAPIAHLMAGLVDDADPAAQDAYRRSIAYAAERLAPEGTVVTLEPINRRDFPGYFLSDVDGAATLIGELGLPNVKLQFDLYHCQIIHGDVTMRLRWHMPVVGHIQIASVPSRGEPDQEELNYPFLLREIDRLGYAGFIGCEYRPRAGTLDGLGWMAAMQGGGA